MPLRGRGAWLLLVITAAGCGEAKQTDHRHTVKPSATSGQDAAAQHMPSSPGVLPTDESQSNDDTSDKPSNVVPAAPVQTLLLPSNALGPKDLGVVVNDRDPQSVAVAAYYQAKRKIPAENIIHLSFDPALDILPPSDFAPLKAAADAKAGDKIQAYALTWKTPYRVGCMSITSAFALGYADKYCNTGTGPCSSTATVPSFDQDLTTPAKAFGIKPTMALAAESLELAKALIDRGVTADDTFPKGTGYMVATTDAARSVRASDFQQLAAAWPAGSDFGVSYVDNRTGTLGDAGNAIVGKKDVMFYFTGLMSVPSLETLSFLPGAPADHLTSYGGIISGNSGQMSILRWLEAGATGSYGTVVEPCNFTGKFPSPKIFWPRYFRGKTLLEAYWASVLQPGEGLLVGEPLAKPFGKAAYTFADKTLTVDLTWLKPGTTYVLEAADTEAGPFTSVKGDIKTTTLKKATISLPDATRLFYRLRTANP